MEKITIAKRNEELRKAVFERIIKPEVLEELKQVAGSKWMIDQKFMEEYFPVRVDIVVPKIAKDDPLQTADDFADAYQQEQEEKRLAKEEKQKAKEKKITRDKKLREQRKLAKEKGEQ